MLTALDKLLALLAFVRKLDEKLYKNNLRLV